MCGVGAWRERRTHEGRGVGVMAVRGRGEEAR